MSTKLILIIAAICCLVCSLLSSVVTYKITDGKWQTKYDNHLIEDNEKRDSYLKTIRNLETDIANEQDKAEKDAKLLEETYYNDLSAANDVADRLREKLRILSASGTGTHTGVDRERAKAATDSVVYRQLFERANARAGDLAEYADRLGKAIIICENKYDAVYNTLSGKTGFNDD